MSTEVRIMRLPHAAGLPLPAYQSAHAAGLDLIAAVPADAPIEIAPGGRILAVSAKGELLLKSMHAQVLTL